MLKIYTSTVYGYKNMPDMLDITVKTAKEEGKPFIPTWDIVMNHKNGKITDLQYVETYRNLMRNSWFSNQDAWCKLLQREEVVLLCFCTPGAFCHRYVLAAMLVLQGAVYCGEKKKDGTIDESTKAIVNNWVEYLRNSK